MTIRKSMIAIVLLSAAFTVAGCSKQQPSNGEQASTAPAGGSAHADVVDPHDVPITEEQKQQLRQQTAEFANAVVVVKQLRDITEHETRDGLPENPFEVHQALDKADLITQWLPEIARDSNIPKQHWETVTTAANELRELFDGVHLNIDGRKDPDFASVQPQMDARIAELQAIVK